MGRRRRKTEKERMRRQQVTNRDESERREKKRRMQRKKRRKTKELTQICSCQMHETVCHRDQRQMQAKTQRASETSCCAQRYWLGYWQK